MYAVVMVVVESITVEVINSWGIGYNLGKKYWGKGYTTEAMKQIISFAQEELGITEIVGRYAKENPASGKVMEKLDFDLKKKYHMTVIMVLYCEKGFSADWYCKEWWPVARAAGYFYIKNIEQLSL